MLNGNGFLTNFDGSNIFNGTFRKKSISPLLISEPGISSLEKTAPPGELEFFSIKPFGRPANTNANPVLSDSRAPQKFQFCM